jgi:hypothetical protein
MPLHHSLARHPALRRVLVIVLALIAHHASIASAGGINLAWDSCLGAGGVTNKDFICNLNGPTHTLFISFDPDVEMLDVAGSNPIIDLQSASTSLPPWWQFKNPDSCRPSSLSATPATTGGCVDPWGGEAVAGIAAYLTTAVLPSMATNRARVLGSVTIGMILASAHVIPGTEYFDLAIRINSTGTDNCSGCLDPVCLVLNEVLLTTYNSGNQILTRPLVCNYATWQGGAVGDPGCPAATPTANRTWGQVKSAYR